MTVAMDAAYLHAFEADIAGEFNAARIRAPIHLDGGNEAHLVRYFGEHFKAGDWVFCSWRSHAKALLAGIPEEEVRDAILAGRSIALCFPQHRFYSSAIVSGHHPWALGVALALKRAGRPEHVHAFVGDMAARTGTFHECSTYARNFDLPVTWIVEDNGKSVLTDTSDSWGEGAARSERKDVVRYEYKMIYPHAGAGVRVNF